MMLFKWLVLVVVCAGGGFGEVREKRTLDFVLRSVADAFGYDVQKRPSLLPLAAPTQAARPSSTFFPPPVKPLPPLPRLFPIIPRPTVVITLPARPVAAPAAPPAPAAAPRALPPPAPKAGAPRVPARPAAPAPAPAPAKPAAPAPAPAPAKPAAPAPAAPAPAAPAPAPRVTAPPLLTENVRKTFNIAFNVVRDIQTPAPPAAPAPAPAPAVPPKPAAPAPPARKAAPPPPPPRTPAPPPPPPPRAPAPSRPPKRAELYQLYPDYYDSREKYQNVDPANYDYDLTNGQQLAQPKENYDDTKQRFKESLDTFWRGSPWIQQQNGYKYLTPAPPAPQNKYEEYELEEELPQRYRDEEAKYAAYEDVQPQNEENEYYVETYKDSNQAPVVRHYAKNPDEQESNNKINYSKERPDFTKKPNYSKERPNFTKKQPTPFKPEPQNQNRNQGPRKAYLSQSDRIKIFSPEESKKPHCVKVKRRPVTTSPKSATVAPQFAGVLPVSLHALTDKSRNPWPLPFDADYSGLFKREVREKADYSYVPESYEVEASYEPPEPEAVNYKALEKLTNFEDVDEDLSDKAKVRTSQFGKKVTVVKVDKGVSQMY